MVVVLIGAGCSVTPQPANARGKYKDKQRNRASVTTVANQDQDEDQDDQDQDATDTTVDGDADGADGDGNADGADGDGNADGDDGNVDDGDVDGDAGNDDGDVDGDAGNDDGNAGGDDGDNDGDADGDAGNDDGNAGDDNGDDNGDDGNVDGVGGELPFSTTECDPAGLPVATGQQTDEIGSAVCNTGIFGVIPGPDNTPVVKITAPRNGDTFPTETNIPCEIEFENFQGGLFDQTGKNGQEPHFGLRPFSVNEDGDPVGHAHCYIRDDEAGPTDELESFLALNDPNVDNTLAGEMPGVTEPGRKKLCVDLAGGNHMTFPKGVAQRFPATDCVTIRIR